MDDCVFSVALVTRGAGAYAYSWRGPQGLSPGRLCAVVFQHKLEVGLVLGTDPAPPDKPLAALWPLQFPEHSGWGALLLELCELSASAPDELAGHLLFATPAASLKLSLSLPQPELLPESLRDAAAPLAGVLTAPKRRGLAKLQQWDELARAASSGAVEISTAIAGTPGTSRSPAGWRNVYKLSTAQAGLLGLDGAQTLPGSYLAGFAGFDLATATKSKAAVKDAVESTQAVELPPSSLPAAQPLSVPADWDLAQRWPRRAELRLSRRFASWPQLRREGGLAAELTAAAHAGQRVLLIAPQVWMLERLWPQLAPAAALALRFRSDAGPSAAAHILAELTADARGRVVIGGPGAWKLTAYAGFDRVIVLDPSHPQYTPERTPHLDPRLALLLAAPEPTQIEFVELGLSYFDGAMDAAELMLHAPHEPAASPGSSRRDSVDTDPLPLELRRPDLRRLVYFNRLGRGRGLYCAECFAPVTCPRCGSRELRWSAQQGAYVCPDCGLQERELRCPRCGLGMLTAASPGLEAVMLRPGDEVVSGTARPRQREWQSVLGTAQLLDPLPGFWPQQLVYVHAEGRLGMVSDWPAALDMLLRLRALYANPELAGLHLVSARVHDQFAAGESGAAPLAPQQIREAYAAEFDLRRFAGLPPFGCLYHLHATAARPELLAEARHALGETLRAHPGTELLRLGSGYREGRAHRLGGWLVNPQLDLRALQELRWEIHRLGATLTIAALRGPWL